MSAQRKRLDANRWHWQHGPIDIVAQADGDPCAVAASHEAAWQRFETILGELVGELPALRTPIDVAGDAHVVNPMHGPIARRMWTACRPHAQDFITPMAAVAGAVAEELIGFYRRPGIARAWINNGGDIALHLAPGQRARVGLFADLSRVERLLSGGAALDGAFEVSADMPVRGVATSGWRGRSLSLGIADSVTVLAASASIADAVATMVANAVDVVDAGIARRPACEVKDESDLGERLVTVDVAELPAIQVRRALDAGVAVTRQLQRRGLLHSAVLVCQGQIQDIGAVCSTSKAAARAVVASACEAPAPLGSIFA